MTPGIPVMDRPHLRIVAGHRLPDREGVEPTEEWMTFLVKCPHCKEETGLRIKSVEALAWQRGALIQNAFPDLGKDDRERLMTGICAACWEKDIVVHPEDHPFEADPNWADLCGICGESEAAHEED